ncbi:ribosomal protein S5 domain 2-type protein [Thelephora terrestris]|uniref:Ribosomal protein S5 domain 2-type protein n=1 Tax=Thelephora terrestris TaxID=56493 RepID=A0A9P6HCI0_9AGAM|nr:ribosomal protein S5 domain 2-type protein [Thelephora terrestris]
MQSSLDHFVSSQPAASPPAISFTSQEIRDRKSAFVAYIIPAKDASQVKDAIAYIRRTHANRSPAHEVAAWRFMSLKPGMTGLGGEDDFEVISSYDDDGEKWAGGRVLNIMKQAGVLDAVVVVSRWFGGIMLGPTRFTHIETCAAEVCKRFKLQEDLKDCRTMLSSLDDILADLRSEFTTLTARPSTHKTMDYDSIEDLAKLRKLVTAREAAIKSINMLITRAKERGNTRSQGEKTSA